MPTNRFGLNMASAYLLKLPKLYNMTTHDRETIKSITGYLDDLSKTALGDKPCPGKKRRSYKRRCDHILPDGWFGNTCPTCGDDITGMIYSDEDNWVCVTCDRKWDTRDEDAPLSCPDCTKAVSPVDWKPYPTDLDKAAPSPEAL